MSELTDSHSWLHPETWGTPRWKTAIKRPTLSPSLRILFEGRAKKSPTTRIAFDQLPKSGSWLDFGCGYGQDVTRLPERYEAVGFDPYYNPRYDLISKSYCVVSLIYVLNVIENDPDRDRTLQFAFSLCTKALVLAVRTDRKESGITNIGTFQKYYKRQEFVDYVQNQLPDQKAIDIGSGRVIVLKK